MTTLDINFSSKKYAVSGTCLVEILDTTLSEISEANLITNFASGDSFKMIYENKKEAIVISVYYNLKRIIQFSVEPDCLVKPEFKILRFNEDTRNYITVNNSKSFVIFFF